MVKREDLYGDFQAQVDFIDRGLHKLELEELSASETVAVSSLERQKASLEGKKVQLQQQLEEVGQEIASIDARIARMKAT